jgi:outer membrane protein assembly factor BamB
LGVQLSTDDLPRHHSVYRIDWRAFVTPSTENGPIDLVVSRYAPLESSIPVVVARQSGPKAEVVVGGSNGVLKAFTLRGKLLWQFQGGGPMGSPIADGAQVLVGCGDGQLYALSADDGSLLWSYATGEELGSAPAVSNGMVFVLSNSDTLFALDAQTGKWAWRYRREASGHEFAIRSVSSPLLVGDLAVAGFSDGAVVALRPKDGAVVWQHMTSGSNELQDSDGSPQTDGQRVFVANYKDGLTALALQDGHILWQRALPTASQLRLSRGTLFASAVGKLAAFNAYDGTPLWEKGTGSLTATGMLTFPGLLVVSIEGPMMFLDSRTGRPLGKAFEPGKSGITSAPGLHGRDLYVLSNNGWLYAMHLL